MLRKHGNVFKNNLTFCHLVVIFGQLYNLFMRSLDADSLSEIDVRTKVIVSEEAVSPTDDDEVPDARTVLAIVKSISAMQKIDARIADPFNGV